MDLKPPSPSCVALLKTYPMTASPLVIEGEDGGVAVTSLARPEVEGGEVEGTVRLMMGESSPSPTKEGGCEASTRKNKDETAGVFS